MQMTSYLDTTKISGKETYSESSMEIRRRDVTCCHFLKLISKSKPQSHLVEYGEFDEHRISI